MNKVHVLAERFYKLAQESEIVNCDKCEDVVPKSEAAFFENTYSYGYLCKSCYTKKHETCQDCSETAPDVKIHKYHGKALCTDCLIDRVAEDESELETEEDDEFLSARRQTLGF